MKVKIGNEWYDSNDQPVAVEFQDDELSFVKDYMTKETAPNNRFGVGVWYEENPEEAGREWIRDADQ